jgi:hypothetical protein
VAKGPSTIGLLAGGLAGAGIFVGLFLYTRTCATMIGASVTMIVALGIDFLVTAGLTRLFIRLDLPEYGEWGGPD